jgi:hypothetical protein
LDDHYAVQAVRDLAAERDALAAKVMEQSDIIGGLVAEARHAALVAAAREVVRRTDSLTVHFTGGQPYLVVKPDWVDALRAALIEEARNG